MLTIQIDQDEGTTTELEDYLRDVADKVSNGFTSGEGWELTGSDESEDGE